MRSCKIAARMESCCAVRSLILAAFFFCGAAPNARAQGKPLGSIELDCRAIAVANNGTAACAAFHKLHFQHYEIERDDIWTVTREGKRKRIVDGEKLIQTTTPFSYSIRRLAFSPDGSKLTVQMDTRQVMDEKGAIHPGELVDLMTAEGKEIPIAGTKTSVILNGKQAEWMAGGDTVAYLVSSEESDLLYRVGIVHPSKGKGSVIFANHLFTAVAWDPVRTAAIVIERDLGFTKPPQLVRLDLNKETEQTLASLQGYLGQLTLSPRGDKVAYFRDGDTLEVRSLADPTAATTVHCAYGTFAWSADETRILLKRGPADQSNDLVWVAIPGGNLTPILHDLIFHAFALSPNSDTLAVLQPGTNHLELYPSP